MKTYLNIKTYIQEDTRLKLTIDDVFNNKTKAMVQIQGESYMRVFSEKILREDNWIKQNSRTTYAGV